MAADPELALVEAERQEFGISHAEVGAAALGVMKFPAEFVYAVGHHHCEPTAVESLLGRVVLGADAIANHLEPTTERNADVSVALAALQIPVEAQDTLLDEVRQDQDNLSGFLTVRG
jgi:hypothetical protein